ncbi:MAG: hypothetical protein HY908_21605 [Myxococcales bacterium]|nr:hypothetical protein [Myxococcales bacterium]
MMNILLGAAAVLAGVLVSTSAHAELTEAEKRAAAEALYATAEGLLAKQDFTAACAKLEEVVKLQPLGVGAKLTLADCYLGAGKLASAHAMLGQAASLAAQAGQTARAAEVQERAAALAPRLSKLTIAVPAAVQATPGLVVRRDGATVAAALFGVTVPIDGGTHVVSANAPERLPFERKLDIAPEGAAITVEVGPLGAAQAPVATPAPVSPPAEPGWPVLRVGGFVTGGLGLGLAVVGVAVAGSGIGRTNDAVDVFAAAQARGDANGETAARAEHDAARTQTVAGWATAGVGGAALVAGIVMAALPAGDAEPATGSTTVRVGPWLDGTTAGAGLRGAW